MSNISNLVRSPHFSHDFLRSWRMTNDAAQQMKSLAGTMEAVTSRHKEIIKSLGLSETLSNLSNLGGFIETIKPPSRRTCCLICARFQTSG